MSARAYVLFADKSNVIPLIVIVLDSGAGTYVMFVFNVSHFEFVCPGVVEFAIIISPTCIGFHPRVPATDIFQQSHFLIAHAVQLQPVVGQVPADASNTVL